MVRCPYCRRETEVVDDSGLKRCRRCGAILSDLSDGMGDRIPQSVRNVGFVLIAAAALVIANLPVVLMLTIGAGDRIEQAYADHLVALGYDEGDPESMAAAAVLWTRFVAVSGAILALIPLAAGYYSMKGKHRRLARAGAIVAIPLMGPFLLSTALGIAALVMMRKAGPHYSC